MTAPTVVVDVDDDLAALAERLEGALEMAGRRGMSPAAAARAVRLRHHRTCTTADARAALLYLAGRQYAHTGTRNPGQFFPGQPT